VRRSLGAQASLPAGRAGGTSHKRERSELRKQAGRDACASRNELHAQRLPPAISTPSKRSNSSSLLGGGTTSNTTWSNLPCPR
jgi:hypothetical protein